MDSSEWILILQIAVVYSFGTLTACVTMNKSSKEVSSLARGLAILSELNRAGSVRAGKLAGGLGLARPTVYRLLDTLEEAGFVAKSASDERYRITQRTAQFFDRYNASTDGAAAEILESGAKRSSGLLHLSTFEKGAMVVRLTGRPAISVLPWRGFIGLRLSLLESATGKAFVASCNETQRLEILAHLQSSNTPATIKEQIDRIRTEVSEFGYASCLEPEEPCASSLSVGLTYGGYAVGALTAVLLQGPRNDLAKVRLVESLYQLKKRLGPHVRAPKWNLVQI